MSRAIVSVGNHPSRGFGRYLERFRRTFKEFGCCDDIMTWENDWPPGSPSHQQVHYAFKVYAVAAAARLGHATVLWVDCSGNAVASLEPFWKSIEERGYYLAGSPSIDPETGFVPPEISMSGVDKLGCWSSDKSLAQFNLSRDDAMRVTLLSGSCFGLDFRHPIANQFFNTLKSYAVPGNYNGTHASGLLGRPDAKIEGESVSLDPRCQGHRSDEVYMTLIARQMKMTSALDFFTGGMAQQPTTVIRSGYDL